MGKIILLALMAAAALSSCAKREECHGECNKPVDKDHNVFIQFMGTDKELPKDGELLIITGSKEDTIMVEPAKMDDCRRFLEERGQG